MFMYSKRKNTPANNYENQIDEETKNKRLQTLMRLQDKIAYNLSQKYIGKLVKVLIEGESKKIRICYMEELLHTKSYSSQKQIKYY